MIILGGGLAGCLTGLMFGQATVYEAQEQLKPHRALLRFRSDNISRITGIPFKKVRVHKAIYSEGKLYSHCNPQLANLYSRKVVGGIADRSIWSLDPVERWIAPRDFHEQLALLLDGRLRLGHPVTGIESNAAFFGGHCKEHFDFAISTMPLKVTQSLLGINRTHEFYIEPPAFRSSSIRVIELPMPETDVHQTIYFPDTNMPAYRASIVGDRMIVELSNSCMRNDATLHNDLVDVYRAFGLAVPEEFSMKESMQRFGKLLPMKDEAKRRNAIFQMTQRFRIYSLGRFACWRNIVMDDVYDDILKIRSLLGKDAYEHSLKG